MGPGTANYTIYMSIQYKMRATAVLMIPSFFYDYKQKIKIFCPPKKSNQDDFFCMHVSFLLMN